MPGGTYSTHAFVIKYLLGIFDLVAVFMCTEYLFFSQKHCLLTKRAFQHTVWLLTNATAKLWMCWIQLSFSIINTVHILIQQGDLRDA